TQATSVRTSRTASPLCTEDVRTGQTGCGGRGRFRTCGHSLVRRVFTPHPLTCANTLRAVSWAPPGWQKRRLIHRTSWERVGSAGRTIPQGEGGWRKATSVDQARGESGPVTSSGAILLPRPGWGVTVSQSAYTALV